jgi:SAM-dependent methyltransferase
MGRGAGPVPKQAHAPAGMARECANEAGREPDECNDKSLQRHRDERLHRQLVRQERVEKHRRVHQGRSACGRTDSAGEPRAGGGIRTGLRGHRLGHARPYRITGVDISDSFVRIASENARTAGVDVEFRPGNASDLPFAAESFDLVYCRAAFKNFADPARAIAEMHRVLRPGGLALIQDLRPDATNQAIADTVRSLNLDRVNAIITTWMFKHILVKRATSRQQLEAMAAASPFKTCKIVESPIGYEVVLRKDRRITATTQSLPAFEPAGDRPV